MGVRPRRGVMGEPARVVAVVDGIIQNALDGLWGGGTLQWPTLLALALLALLLLMPLLLLCWAASELGPAGNAPIPYQPTPGAPRPPRRAWAADAKERRWVEARLTALRAQRPTTPRQLEAAYGEAVYKFRGWSASGYTGTLRPHIVAPQRKLPPLGKIQRPDYAGDGTPRGEMAERLSFRRAIRRLSQEEVGRMRVAGRLGREVLDAAGLAVQPGVRCDEIDTVVHEACLKRNCYPSPLNYMQFPKSVCTSVNEVICHGVPDGYELQVIPPVPSSFTLLRPYISPVFPRLFPFFARLGDTAPTSPKPEPRAKKQPARGPRAENSALRSTPQVQWEGSPWNAPVIEMATFCEQ